MTETSFLSGFGFFGFFFFFSRPADLRHGCKWLTFKCHRATPRGLGLGSIVYGIVNSAFNGSHNSLVPP